MSEYQRYEFMTIDRPLTRAQLDAVKGLSSHIDASSTHALIEYDWGDFKHDPIDVLYEFFDGFLYWANWGAPRLALRFPHGALPGDLLAGYDLDDFVTFIHHPDYDVVDLHFDEMEGPDEWIDYELGSLIAIRDELLAGDLRALYIAWLAAQRMMASNDEVEDYEISVPAVPSGLGTLTAAQQALGELLQLPEELLGAAARHSAAAQPASDDGDAVATWLTLLPPERRDDYLRRLARNEPGLSRQLAKELRELRQEDTGTVPPAGERITYATLLAESKAIKGQLERERREQERLARLRHLQDVHDHQDDYWRQAEQAAERRSGVGYDDATKILIELRDVAVHFKMTEQFQERFRAWVRPHLQRPAFVKRLQSHRFILPEA